MAPARAAVKRIMSGSPLDGRQREGGGHGEERHAAGEAVEPVDEVHGVDDPDDPEHGEGEGEQAELEGRPERLAIWSMR